jgi:hypothetical protein
MFYLDSPQMEAALRFGDVIQGFPICFSVIDNPLYQSDFNITVSAPTYAVVLSPCCSIEDNKLAIAPLKQLENKIFVNPYLSEDPMRINSKIPAEKSLPPIAWDTMDSGEKANRMAKREAYIFVDKFVYAPSALFAEYTINRKDGNIKTNYYVVDFRDSIKVACDRINREYSPGAAKVLQLSVETRELMRRKIASFYQRVPDEDAAILES